MSVALPLAVGWAGALVLAFLDGRRRWVGALGIVAGLGLLAALAGLAAEVAAGAVPEVVTGGWPAEIGIRLRADALGVVFALASVALLVAVLAFEVARGPETRAFPALVLLLGTGLTGLFLTADVFNFYVFFELSMVAAFALAGYGGGRAEARAAAVFVVVNVLGSVLFLGAVAVVYRLTGTLDMAAVARQAGEAPPGVLLLVGAVLLSAFGLKLGLFPFHYWLPVVYRESRPAVAAIYAGALANLGAYGLLRFGGEVLPGVLPAGRTVLLVLGAASVVYGEMQAVHRRDLRDLLAYSAIGQVGFVVLALALGGREGFAAAVLFSVVNALHKTALFLGTGVAGAGVAPAFLIAGLSLAGLPPSAGFAGKVALLRAGAAAGSWVMPAVLLAGSALALLYVLQGWQHRFRREREEDGDDRGGEVPAGGEAGSGEPAGERSTEPADGRSPGAARAVVVALALAVVALGLWPAPLVEWSGRAAAALGVSP